MLFQTIMNHVHCRTLVFWEKNKKNKRTESIILFLGIFLFVREKETQEENMKMKNNSQRSKIPLSILFPTIINTRSHSSHFNIISYLLVIMCNPPKPILCFFFWGIAIFSHQQIQKTVNSLTILVLFYTIIFIFCYVGSPSPPWLSQSSKLTSYPPTRLIFETTILTFFLSFFFFKPQHTLPVSYKTNFPSHHFIIHIYITISTQINTTYQ